MGIESRQKWRGAEGKFKKLQKSLMETDRNLSVIGHDSMRESPSHASLLQKSCPINMVHPGNNKLSLEQHKYV